jgi:hypothetical protein
MCFSVLTDVAGALGVGVGVGVGVTVGVVPGTVCGGVVLPPKVAMRKVATVLADSARVTVQVVELPVHSPAHDSNSYPVSGTAVKTTSEPAEYE